MSFLSLSSSHSPPLRWSLPLSYYTTTATVTATVPAASRCSKNRTSERGHLRPPVVVVIVALDLWLQRWEDAGYRGDFRVVCYPHHHPADRSILCLGGGVPLLIIVSYTFLSLSPYPALSFARSLAELPAPQGAGAPQAWGRDGWKPPNLPLSAYITVDINALARFHRPVS